MVLEDIKYEVYSPIKETDNVSCYLIAADTFYCYHKEDTISDVDDIEFIFNAYQELITPLTDKYKVIVELGPYSSITSAAREFLENHKTPAKCEAIITYNLAQRLIINFYFKFKSHQHPSKAFKNRENAWNWIQQF